MTKEELIKDLEQAVSNQDENILQDLAKQALANFPEETFGYEYTLKVLLDRDHRDYDSIEACYIRLIQLNEGDNSYKEIYAKILEEKGDLEKSASVYLNIYEDDPDNIKALGGLGNYFLKAKNDLDAALPFLENASTHENAGSEEFVRLAFAYKDLDRKEDALKLLNLSLSEEFSKDAAVLKIEVLSELKRNEETIELYNALIGHYPGVLAYHYNYAKILDVLERFGTAVYQYEEAIQIAEREHMATAALYLEYGMSLLRIGSYEKSVKAIKTSLEVSTNAIVQVELLKALNGAKQFDEAKELAQALLNDSDLGEIFKKQVRFEIAMIHYTLGEWDQARTIFDKLSKTAGAKAIGNYGLGILADKEEENTVKAVALLKAALSMGHKEAQYYIEDEMLDKLVAIKSRILAEHNEKSDLSQLQGLTSKLLVFKGILTDGQLDVSSNMNKFFKHTIFFLNSNGGFILYSDGFYNEFVHNVAEKEGGLELERIFLDGQASNKLRLSVKNDDLIYQDRPERTLVFATLTEMTSEVRSMIYKYINFDHLDFLGEADVRELKALL